MEDIEKAEIRGVPLKAGSTLSEWTTDGPTDYERMRPITNVDDAVKKLIWVYDNPEKTEHIKERAYQWVQNLGWEAISKKWDELFTDVYNRLEDERKNAKQKNSSKPDKSKSQKSK